MESDSFNSCSKLVEFTDAQKSEDDTLIIIVNENGTISVDPSTLQKLLASQPNQNSRLSVVSVDSATYDNPPKAETTEVSETANVASSSSTSNAPANYSLVDPFLDLGHEELQKLESALKSEKGRQILGENVAAMLDMLNKEGETHIAEGTQILSQNIHNDHCYSASTGNGKVTPTSTPVKSTTQTGPRTYAVKTQNVKVVQGNSAPVHDKKPLKQTTLGAQFRLVQTPSGGTQVVLQKDGQQSVLKTIPTAQKPVVTAKVEEGLVKAMESITTASTSEKRASIPRSTPVFKATSTAPTPPLPPSKYPRRENRRPPAHLLNEEYETPLAPPVGSQPLRSPVLPTSQSTDQKISALDLLESIHAAVDMDIGGTPSSDEDEESEVSFCEEVY